MDIPENFENIHIERKIDTRFANTNGRASIMNLIYVC